MRKLCFILGGILGFLLFWLLVSSVEAQEWGETPEQRQAAQNAAEIAYSYQDKFYGYPVVREDVYRWNPTAGQHQFYMQSMYPAIQQNPGQYREVYYDLTTRLSEVYGIPQQVTKGGVEYRVWYPEHSRAYLLYNQAWRYRIEAWEGE